MNGKIMLNGKAYSSSGRPSREVTMSEWLALPDTKYTDGIVYYIKDVGGANQFPPLIYSDEEREVGVWRDGKPLYQKSYHFQGALNQDVLIDSTITQTDNELVNVFGSWAIGNYHYTNSRQASIFETINFLGNTTPHPIVFVNSSGLYYNSNQNNYGFNMYLTVQYTKTTDTPGSGTWTAQGGYAHHYDNVEKVIGTFFGKPLYERSWDLGADVSLPNDHWTSLGIPNDGTIDLITANYGTSEWGIIRAISTSSKVDANYIVSMSTRNGTEVVRYITLQYTKTTD